MSDGLETPVSPDPLAIDVRQRFGLEIGQRRDEQALQHAGRILEHLRVQLAELDRREQNLNSQLSAMDQERRSLRLWSQQFTDDAERREEELRAREIKLAEREAASDAYSAEVESREKSLAAEW
jgi:chromosome segregation ATPase